MRGIRLAKSFIIIMLLCLFFSRSIYYFLTPKVLTERARAGSLHYEIAAQSVRWSCENPHRVSLEAVLAEGLTVEAVFVRSGTLIQTGDRLLSFSSPHGEKLLQDAEAALARACDALTVWDQEYGSEKLRLENELKRAALEKEQGGDDLSDLRIDELNRTLNDLLNDKIIQGTSRMPLKTEMEQRQAQRDCLERLRQDGWVIRSDVDGRVMDVFTERAQMADGSAPLLSVAPEDAEICIRCEISEDDMEILSYGKASVSWNSSLSVDFVIADREDGVAVLAAADTDVLRFVKSLPDPFVMNITSEKYGVLAPNRAIIGNTVYVLRERDTFLGKRLYAEAVEVETGVRDDMNTAIIRGLSQGDEVITNWDRTLSPDTEVMRPLQ